MTLFHGVLVYVMNVTQVSIIPRTHKMLGFAQYMPEERKLHSQDAVSAEFNMHSFYPRDAMLARVFAKATCPSVCLYVRLSVTCRYCVKTKKASVMISSPSGSPTILVF